MEAVYQDATGFPIFDQAGEVSHVAIMFITTGVYKGNISIAKAVEYRNKKYSLTEAAKAAGLSPYHFARVFKSNMGITPRNYYIKYSRSALWSCCAMQTSPFGMRLTPAAWNTPGTPSVFSRNMSVLLPPSTGT